MVNERVWGQLMTIDLHDCNNKKLCKEIEMVPYGEPLLERFGDGPLEGYSMIQFIETSSITIHLDEVWNRAFIDIFSCKVFNKTKAKNFCKKFFEAEKVKYRKLYR